tara:strand:+ start:740 stop:850 length:111 start_codon:yes stop_codon:yes gene_type:complete
LFDDARTKAHVAATGEKADRLGVAMFGQQRDIGDGA